MEMAAKNSTYWEKRIAAGTWKTYNSLEEKNRDLLEFYTDASEQIKKELYLIAEKYSKDGVLSLSEMHKQNRLTALNKKFEDIIEELGHKTEKSAKKNMQDGFQAVYKNTAVSMGNEDFSMPNKKLMEKLLQEPWRGDSFSGRLWKNQKKLAVGLNDLLLGGLQQGKTATEIAVSLHNFMGQGFNECHRLVRTETMHYLNDATLRRYKDAGVEYVQIWAAEDERTCDECSKYHGKIYPLDECPHVPFHPNCRCTIIPVTDGKLVAKYEKKDIKKDVEKKDNSDIINPSIAKAGSAVAVIRSLGNIKEDIIVKEFGKIQTDEIIVTEERENHIKERHPEDFELFKKYGDEAVTDPDYIIRDGKHEGTVFMVMKLPNTNLNVVVRIALESDGSGLKNSVMTFYRIRERNLKKLIEKNTALLGKDAVLYKKE